MYGSCGEGDWKHIALPQLKRNISHDELWMECFLSSGSHRRKGFFECFRKIVKASWLLCSQKLRPLDFISTLFPYGLHLQLNSTLNAMNSSEV